MIAACQIAAGGKPQPGEMGVHLVFLCCRFAQIWGAGMVAPAKRISLQALRRSPVPTRGTNRAHHLTGGGTDVFC